MKIVAEHFRGDQNILTSNNLELLDFADKNSIKKLYNYNLVSLRELQEMQNEVRHEYLTGKINPDPIMAYLERNMERHQKYSGMIQKIKKKKAE